MSKNIEAKLGVKELDMLAFLSEPKVKQKYR
jgi:hypothetical protein